MSIFPMGLINVYPKSSNERELKIKFKFRVKLEC